MLQSHEKLKQFNIMLIDDDRLVRRLVYDVLVKLGFGNVYPVEDGATALDQMNNVHVDFIICDWRMTHMDGIEVAKLIRRAGTSANPLVPIIMLTGNAEAHHVVEARDAGVNEYLVKPFTVKELGRRIMEIVDRPREFVIANHFKGPSRRRKSATWSGPKERRKRAIRPIKVKYDS